ncbi:MAG: UbiA family prenyltransferase [Bacteroidota bacterium]
MQRLIRFLLESNIFISLCALFVTVETQVQLGLQPQWHPYLFLIFFATFFEYNFHRLVTVLRHNEAMEVGKHEWVGRNKRLFFLLVILSAIGFATALCFAKPIVLLALIPIALLTLFYSFPLTKKYLTIFRLREIPYLKIFMIALVWGAATVIIPIIQTEHRFASEQVVAIFFERVLFVLAITIPFDIRDMEHDKRVGLKTIPHVLGEQRAIILANIILLGSFCISVIRCMAINDWAVLFAYSCSIAITFVVLNHKGIKQSKFYHYGYLDGTLILQAICIVGINFL